MNACIAADTSSCAPNWLAHLDKHSYFYLLGIDELDLGINEELKNLFGWCSIRWRYLRKACIDRQHRLHQAI